MRNYDTKIYTYTDRATGALVVKAITTYAGQPVSATAKCDPTDDFDIEFGKQLALKRLDLKIAKKRQASMTSWFKHCDQYLEYLKAEERRTRKVKEYAEITATDHKIEAKKLEAEIAEMLSK